MEWHESSWQVSPLYFLLLSVNCLRLKLAASINAVMRMAMSEFWGLFTVGFFLGDERETAAIGSSLVSGLTSLRGPRVRSTQPPFWKRLFISKARYIRNRLLSCCPSSPPNDRQFTQLQPSVKCSLSYTPSDSRAWSITYHLVKRKTTVRDCCADFNTNVNSVVDSLSCQRLDTKPRLTAFTPPWVSLHRSITSLLTVKLTSNRQWHERWRVKSQRSRRLSWLGCPVLDGPFLPLVWQNRSVVTALDHV